MHGFAYIFCCWGWFNFILLDCYFSCVIFFGHPIYCHYNAKIILGLIKSNFVGVIFFGNYLGKFL